MIYEFKSRATGSVIMTKPVAEWILQIVGKPAGKTGIITVEQMPAAIDALHNAIAAEKQQLRETRASDEGSGSINGSADSDDPKAAEDDDAYPISLAQRAFPFIEMLQEAHRAGKDVTWGV